MSNYNFQHANSTSAGSATIRQAGIGLGLASLLLMAHLAAGQNLETNTSQLSASSPIRVKESSQTFGQHKSFLTGEYERISPSFEEEMASFYTHLLVTQEPLGREFEQVLHDNLWDLLVRT